MQLAVGAVGTGDGGRGDFGGDRESGAREKEATVPAVLRFLSRCCWLCVCVGAGAPPQLTPAAQLLSPSPTKPPSARRVFHQGKDH